MTRIPTTLPRFIWYFSSKYLSYFSGILLVFLFRAAHLSLSPYMMKVIIDRVAQVDTSHGDSGFTELMSYVWIPAVVYVLLGFLMGVVYRIYDYLALTMYPAIKNDIAGGIFKYVELHSYSYFQETFSGSIANKINEIRNGVIRIIGICLESFISTALVFITSAITLYFVHPLFSVIVLVWIVIFVGISIALSKRAQEYARNYSEARSTLTGKIVDSISNILAVKLFAHEKFEGRYLQNFLEDTAQKDRRLQWYLLKVKAVYTVLTAVLVSTVTWLLLYERARGGVSVGDFALIFTIIMFLIDEAFTISTLLINFSEDIGTCRQSLALMSIPQEIVDRPDAKAIKVAKGEIVFDKVSFRYKKGQSIFTDKSVFIHPGEKIGLVGFSGSGKSTFVNLILRFFDVSSGRILIDGQDISHVTQESLRASISMIPQEPVLFHRTIMENIRYGRLQATDQEVIESAKKAHCHEFIMRLKEGYDSLVGERGVKLSGGQRQRIALARAILKNAPILILDEATSALDSVTESYIQESLEELMKGRTTLVIAHRLSTLFSMDRILVFSHGQIVEDGRHQDLIKKDGPYSKLWSMQAGGFLGDGSLKAL